MAKSISPNTAGGFTLAATNAGIQQTNIQVKEVLVYSAAHSTATQNLVIDYLSNVGG